MSSWSERRIDPGWRRAVISGSISVLVLCSMFSIIYAAALEGARTDDSMLFKDEIEKPVPSLIMDELRGGSGYFIENGGQWEEEILFKASTSFGQAVFTKEGIYYNLIKVEPVSFPLSPLDRYPEVGPEMDGEACVIRMSPEGSRRVEPVGSGLREHRINYFIGKTEESWTIGVRTFESLEYRGIWEGADLLFRFDEGQLKYDIHLDGEARPFDIRFRYEGYESIEVFDEEIIIRTPIGECLIDKGPMAYYNDPLGGQLRVRYRDLGDGSFSFDLEGYDGERPVVIDPIMASTFVGSTDTDYPYEMEIDDVGDMYVVGQTNSPGFPLTPGALNKTLTYQNEPIGFLFKLKSDGSKLLHSTFIGGEQSPSRHDDCVDIAIADNGSVLVTGRTESDDFPVGRTFRNWTETPNVWHRSYLVRFDSNFSTLELTAFINGNWEDHVMDMKLDQNGRIFLYGTTSSDEFPLTDDALELPSGNVTTSSNCFLFVTSPDGTDLLFSTLLGGGGFDRASGSFIDRNGDVFLTGHTRSEDFPTTRGAFAETKFDSDGAKQGFLVKLNFSGRSIEYSTFIGGSLGRERIPSTFGVSVVVDENGCAFLAGTTTAIDFPTTNGTYQTSTPGLVDIFLTKFDAAGSRLVFSSIIGTGDHDYVHDIELDMGGDPTFLGYVIEDDRSTYPTTRGAFDTSYNGGMNDIVLTKMDSNGTMIKYSTFIGGSEYERGADLEINSRNECVIAGSSNSYDFPVLSNAFQRVKDTWDDVVALRLNLSSCPGQPECFQARSGDGFVKLGWSKPMDNGGLKVTEYNIYRGVRNDTLERIKFLPGASDSFNDTDVENGVTYYYAISAVNDLGEGLGSPVINATPKAVPDTPGGFDVYPGKDLMNVIWEEPFDNGGFEVLGYRLYRISSKGPDNITSRKLPPNETVYEDREVELAVPYTYWITASNEVGESLPSERVQCVIKTIPSPPRDLKGTCQDVSIYLSWSEPLSTGGEPLQEYRLYRKSRLTEFTLLHSTGPAVTNYIDSSVVVGERYDYHITSVNSMGESDPSEVASCVPFSAPGSPRNLKAVPGDGRISLSWDEPFDTGGSDISNYRVYRTTAGDLPSLIRELDPGTMEFRDDDVENGMEYIYHVTCVSDGGESGPSNEIWVIPMGVCSPPMDLAAEQSGLQVYLSWSPPLNLNGAPLIEYRLYRSTDNGQFTFKAAIGSGVMEYADDDVSYGIEYQYFLTARTSVGESVPSETATCILLGAPSPPLNLSAVARNGFIELSWVPPAVDGGMAIQWYNMLRGSSPDDLVKIGISEPGALSFVDEGVTRGRQYFYAVSAENPMGVSVLSDPVEIVLKCPPDPPTDPSVRLVNGKARVQWSPPDNDGGAEITSYRVQRSDDDGGWILLASLGPEESVFFDGTIEAGSMYRYRVTASNDLGTGDPSVEVEISVPADENGENGGASWIFLSIALLFILLCVISVPIFILRSRTDDRTPQPVSVLPEIDDECSDLPRAVHTPSIGEDLGLNDLNRPEEE